MRRASLRPSRAPSIDSSQVYGADLAVAARLDRRLISLGDVRIGRLSAVSPACYVTRRRLDVSIQLTQPLVVPEYVSAMVKMYLSDRITSLTVTDPSHHRRSKPAHVVDPRKDRQCECCCIEWQRSIHCEQLTGFAVYLQST